MSGFVVLAGLFEPGTPVDLFAVVEGQQRVDGGLGSEVGRRLADADGSVGFDGLEAAQRLIARGYDLYGNPLALTVVALSADAWSELGQPPIRPTPQLVGTQEGPQDRAAPGAPAGILHVGVPVGVSNANEE